MLHFIAFCFLCMGFALMADDSHVVLSAMEREEAVARHKVLANRHDPPPDDLVLKRCGGWCDQCHPTLGGATTALTCDHDALFHRAEHLRLIMLYGSEAEHCKSYTSCALVGTLPGPCTRFPYARVTSGPPQPGDLCISEHDTNGRLCQVCLGERFTEPSWWSCHHATQGRGGRNNWTLEEVKDLYCGPEGTARACSDQNRRTLCVPESFLRPKE